MLKRLHSCVFRMDVDTEFQAAFMDYFNKHEDFSPESMALIDWMEMVKKNVSHAKTQTYVSNRDINQGQEVNPVDIWEGIDTCEETGCNCLTNVADDFGYDMPGQRQKKLVNVVDSFQAQCGD